MKRRMHYKTWSPARPAWVETVTEDDETLFLLRPDGFVEVRIPGKRVFVPHAQILAMYTVDE